MSRMTVHFVREADWLAGKRLALEVNDVIARDRIAGQSVLRRLQGFGVTPSASGASGGGGGFGFGPSLPFGEGVFGSGYLGQGAELVDHVTVAAYPAGDHAVRMRGIDAVGNVGAFGPLELVEHRPTPGRPRNVRVTSGGVLTWVY